MWIRLLRPGAVAAAIFLSAATAVANDVLVFAAASTAVALEDIIHQYDRRSSDRVRASYASSGALARQLQNGAPAALFLSANTGWMDWADRKNLLVPNTKTALMLNRLVLIRPAGATDASPRRDLRGWLDVASRQRLAMADPAHAPAGAYARQALTSLGVWEKFEPHTIRAQNVRAALLLVQRREVGFGIVYQTDARSSPTVQVVSTFPDNSHGPIVYTLAMVRNKNTANAQRFYSHLKSPEGQAVFRRHGFLAP